ncbi:lipoprotein [Streptomyces malachitofuscus]|nr:lipoprotein [Streptomyces malachitofuscus]
MKRRSLPVAVAFATAATLLLTACGGGEETSGTDEIAGADTGASESASPSAPGSSGSVRRPEITLPSDVKNVFEQWNTGDPAKDALLEDVTQRVNATDAAIVAADPDSEALRFYYKGEALAGAATWVQRYVDDGKSITGTVRFYSPDLVMVDKDTAALAYCADESRASDKDRKSGKAEKVPVSKDSYVAYNTRVEKGENGVWQTTSLLSERGNAKCTS